MLSVVTWKWRSPPGYRSKFGPETVNVLRRMVARHYRGAHRFICVTDDPNGLDRDVEIVPLWDDFADLPHPHSPNHPSCYRRLRAFSPDIAALLGERFVSLDLDCVITGDVTPLWDRGEPFVCWGGTHSSTPYNGSMFLMTAGARPKVWTDFNRQLSPSLAKRAGHYGSDQAWISYCLGPNEPRWSTKDGVYSYRVHIARQGGDLPAGAKLVFFNGRLDPWADDLKHLDWIQKHWH